MYVINDTVYINKIHNPTETKIEIIEGQDILYDGVSVTDVNPDTVNKLIVHHSFGEDIIKTDEKLIERFGEHKQEVEAVKKVTVTETTTADTTSDAEDSSDSETTTKTVIEEVACESLEEVYSFVECELE